MTFAAQIEKPEVKKIPLVMIRPRRKVTSWTDMGGGVYRSSWTYGIVNRVWIQFGVELTQAASAAVLGGEWYYDRYNQLLYVGSVVDPTAVGRFVEYELHFSTDYFRGPRDPLDSASEVVDWQPYLVNEPAPQNGSRDYLFGFNPLVSSSINLANAGGALNPHLYDSSFRKGEVKMWIMVNEVMAKAIRRSEVKQTFLGYMGDTVSLSDRTVSISCQDFFSFLDRQMEFNTFAGIATADPRAIVEGQEWPIRRVRGRVQNFTGVNVDYDATPATNKNRDWVLMEEESSLDEATYTLVVDHLAANTATKTFFTETPKVMAGDVFAMTNNGVTRYGTITAVDYAAKWVTHDDFTGRTVTGADTMTRYYIGSITIIREDGQIVKPMPGRDFLRGRGSLGSLPSGTMGVVFADNFEANVSMATPLDPSTDTVYFTVYGPKEAPVYPSSNAAGEATNYGGAAAQPESILYGLLEESGIDTDLIDEDSFADAGDGNTAPLGLAMPRSPSETAYPTYKDMIQLVLQSTLWRLGFVEVGNEIKIGIAPTQPFVASADYDVDELDHRAFDYQHDSTGLYWTVRLNFNKKEILPDGDFADWTLGANDLARDLHLSTKEFTSESLHYRRDDAEQLKDRLTYALGDRRGIYTFILEQRFIDKTAVGASYQLEREDLPGYAFASGTKRSRQLSAIEVSKTSLGVNLVVEDQKGIQDNSGNWS